MVQCNTIFYKNVYFCMLVCMGVGRIFFQGDTSGFFHKFF